MDMTLKNAKKYILPIAALFMLASCGDSKPIKPGSTGKAYEVLLVAPPAMWEGALGDTLRAFFMQPVPMLNQKEPLMDLISIAPHNLKGLLMNHHNILIARSGVEYPDTAIGVAYDVYAKPQIVVELTGPSDSAITAYAWEHRTELLQVFEMAERDQFTAFATGYPSPAIKDKIKEQFDFSLSVPKGYMIRSSSQDFLWVSQELPMVSQGITIYSYPYTGKSDFERDSLLNKRNQFVARIPGPSDNSYMTTAKIIDPEVEYIRIHGRSWAEMKGFWDVEGDYMGGPFITYSTVDTRTNRVISIDLYVYSPKFGKRNYIRELEHIVYTAQFPGNTQPSDKEE